jgi:hypothetical protein
MQTMSTSAEGLSSSERLYFVVIIVVVIKYIAIKIRDSGTWKDEMN